MTQKKLSLRQPELIFILLSAVGTMLICTKSSPLYPTNDWLDANCYMTVGRAMLKGKMPYRDLFEHKGPLLYILHMAASFISWNSFFGVFLIETAACAWTLLLAYRTVSRLAGGHHLWAVPVTAFAVYSSGAFSHGDSAEELCLPLILSTVLAGLEAVLEKRTLTSRESLLAGAAAGAVLWIKFSLLGPWIGIALFFAFFSIRTGRPPELLRMALWAAAGALAVTLPILAYFALCGALPDLFRVYFHDNLFIYGGGSTGLGSNLIDGWTFFIVFMPVGLSAIYLGTAAFIIRREFLTGSYLLASMVTAFVMTFGGHLSYQYYPLILAAYVPAGLGSLTALIKKRFPRVKPPGNLWALPLLAVCLAGCFLASPNVYLMKYSREDMPQYRFAQVINSTSDGKILNYGFLDGGFYLAADSQPDQPYFCCNNTGLEDMIKGQKEYADSGKPDFIITRSYSMQKEEFPMYRCIGEMSFPYCGRLPTYYLYARLDIADSAEVNWEKYN